MSFMKETTQEKNPFNAPTAQKHSKETTTKPAMREHTQVKDHLSVLIAQIRLHAKHPRLDTKAYILEKSRANAIFVRVNSD